MERAAQHKHEQEKLRRIRERVEEYGEDGVKLLDEADAAIVKMSSTEASRTGWLDHLDSTTEQARRCRSAR